MRRLWWLIVPALALAGCGGPKGIDAGTITAKTFTAAHTDTENVDGVCLVGVPVGSTPGVTVCTLHQQIPVETDYPDTWKFNLEACSTPRETNTGNCRKGYVTVTEETYEKYKIGDTYP